MGDQGPFSPEEQGRLRESLFRMLPAAEAVGEAFYRRLFANHPELRTLFPEDMSEQQDKFIQMLGTMVHSLDRPAELRSACAKLGARHRGYGAIEDHYPLVEEALLAALELDSHGLVSAADLALWRRLYRLVAEEMMHID